MEKQPRTVLLGTKITPDLSERLDTLAERMGVTRSELAFRCVRNGLDELEGIVGVMEHPLGNAAGRLLAMFCHDPDDREKFLDQLANLRQSKGRRGQSELPFAPD